MEGILNHVGDLPLSQPGAAEGMSGKRRIVLSSLNLYNCGRFKEELFVITLSKDMETGVELIDSQHRELINRINNLIEMREKSISDGELTKTIDYLGEYVVKHFSDEQDLQSKSNYPKYEEHKGKHTLFVEDFSKLKSEFVNGGNSLDFMLKLNDKLISWIVRHIKGDDAEFGKYYKARAS